ncbi:SDR family oxidoreductase [Streptomyces sp. NBC_01465]|uniref:SDR family oxidoreductase n=1 Tax=Streptomyces sp. NBC_01465 TaxID=2903878 RepID=UPI002E33F3C0|nr:NAD(P)H-binding protein [Streptomyces sp. NBC_01465]
MIVVTGATGNVGRPLVQALLAAGEEVTALSRRPDREEAGVRYRQADLADPANLKAVLDGADALYLLIAGDGGELDPKEIVEAVRAAGVRRIVLQSSQGVGTRPQSVVHAQLRAFEEAVQGSGLEWTVLRPGGFASNAYLWADSVREQRAAAAPFGDVGLPVVDPQDIADVAAAVLLGGGHAGRTYVLTGPAPVTPREQVQAIADAVGEPVHFVALGRAEAREQMVRFMPEAAVDTTLSILGEPTDDELRVSPAVEDVLGRAPRPFAAWAGRSAAAFR